MAEMKSALELAMEKLGKIQSKEPLVALTEEKRQEINALRKQYDAKVAEKEIMMQAEIRKLVQRHPPQEVVVAARQLQDQFQEAKKALQQELEEKVAAIRSSQ